MESAPHYDAGRTPQSCEIAGGANRQRPIVRAHDGGPGNDRRDTGGGDHPYFFLAAVFWVNVLAFFNIAAILVAMVKIASALDASRMMTLQLPTALYVAVACAAPVTPWLLRRLGPRRRLLASIAGLAVTTLAAAFCTSIWPLLVILFLHGLFSAPVSPATQAAVTQRLAPCCLAS